MNNWISTKDRRPTLAKAYLCIQFIYNNEQARLKYGEERMYIIKHLNQGDDHFLGETKDNPVQYWQELVNMPALVV